MSQHRISRVGVVGAGVMGTGIAAHLASAGIDVLLVDIVPRDAPPADGTAKIKAARNAICKSGLDKALALKPAAFQRNSDASRIVLGNLQDDLEALGACDWIVEAVTERLDIKNAVFGAIEPFRSRTPSSRRTRPAFRWRRWRRASPRDSRRISSSRTSSTRCAT